METKVLTEFLTPAYEVIMQWSTDFTFLFSFNILDRKPTLVLVCHGRTLKARLED